MSEDEGKTRRQKGRPKYASAKDMEGISERMDGWSDKMRTIVEGLQNQIQMLNKNQETLVKTLTQMRQGGGGQQSGEPNTAKADVGQTLATVRDFANILKGNQPSTLETLVSMMFRESLMLQRTIRLGMMKRLDITELFPEEDKHAKESGSSE